MRAHKIKLRALLFDLRVYTFVIQLSSCNIQVLALYIILTRSATNIVGRGEGLPTPLL